MPTKRIYLDNAATTPLSPSVFEAMRPYYLTHFGNPSSTYEEGRLVRAAIEKARRDIAALIGAQASEIYFTSGGTEANNMALKCAVRDLGIRRIISSPIEHACVRNSLQSLHHQGLVQVQLLQPDKLGRVGLDQVQAALEAEPQQPSLVSLMQGHNELGTLHDLCALGQLCQAHGAYLHSDTVQSIGHLPLDLQQVHLHFASGSAHKLHGPKGIGFLYLRKGTPIRAWIEGGGQERQLRSGTENVAGIIGLAQALKEAVGNMAADRAKIETLRQAFIQGIRAQLPEDKYRFQGDYQGQYLPHILSLGLKTDLDLGMLLFKLDLQGLSLSAGSACSSGAVKGSSVINLLDLEPGYRSLRLSFSALNELEEIYEAISIISKTIS